ncbi:hypothetical protein RPW65_07950 [Pseudomonas sp. NyZ704]|nr:hypothetical protein RPW65_07950 [Pseudomonas sp. NyZ704]
MNLHLISGPAGSGKTTMLRNLMRESTGEVRQSDPGYCTMAGLARLVRLSFTDPKIKLVVFDGVNSEQLFELTRLSRSLNGRKDLTIAAALCCYVQAPDYKFENLQITHLPARQSQPA